MRQRILHIIGIWCARYTWRMSGLILLLTVIFLGLTMRLQMVTDLSGLLPPGNPMVEEFNYIFEEFNGATNVFVVIQGETDQMTAFAEKTAPKILKLDSWIPQHGSADVRKAHQHVLELAKDGRVPYSGQYFERVDLRQPMEFLRHHALMLTKPDDLENMQDIYSDPNLLPFVTNLNNSLEKEYIQSEEKISTIQKERSAVAFLDAVEYWLELTEQAFYDRTAAPELGFQAATAVSLGSPYFISPDRSTLIMMVIPTFTMLEHSFHIPAITGLEEMLKQAAEAYDVEVGLAGSLALSRDELVATLEDSMLLTLLSLAAILLLYMFTFRMVSAPLLAVTNLVIGVIWAMGLTWILVQELNLFTAMMAIILVGLGIDFSIHIISVYSEMIHKGLAPEKAITTTLEKVGGGIITGGLTTAAAFLTLTTGRSAGISEFGLVNGIGLLMIMLSTLFTLPTLLMLREKYRLKRGKAPGKIRDVAYRPVGLVGSFLFRRWPCALAAIAAVTAFFALSMKKVTFDYNYLNMEPEGLESIRLNDLLIDKFNMSADLTMMTAASVEESHQLTEQLKEQSSISYVESVSDFLPTKTDQRIRQSAVADIHDQMLNQQVQAHFHLQDYERLLEELMRLEANVIEMQDLAFAGGQDMVDEKAARLVGNPDLPEIEGRITHLINRMSDEAVHPDRLSQFNSEFGSAYRQLVMTMSDTALIRLDDLPGSVTDRFLNDAGDRYLISAYPRGDVWNIAYLERFTTELLEVSEHIAGTPPMFYVLIKIIGEDGQRAALLTLAVVFIFLWIDFRSLRLAVLSMIPLLAGIIWMVGFMGLTGVQITLLNVMAIPLILGIGMDDGVHIIHRFKLEGPGRIPTIFSSTGKAIIITSLTTMLSFGSLVFATYRGFGSLGLALFIGVGMCLLTSLIILPSVIPLFFRKQADDEET